eukprot:m.88270 g.88270  ORF g.88270 m.88270 type:complete len:505 (+) comp26174_c0_seq1:225-1739(+)
MAGWLSLRCFDRRWFRRWPECIAVTGICCTLLGVFLLLGSSSIERPTEKQHDASQPLIEQDPQILRSLREEVQALRKERSQSADALAVAAVQLDAFDKLKTDLRDSKRNAAKIDDSVSDGELRLQNVELALRVSDLETKLRRSHNDLQLTADLEETVKLLRSQHVLDARSLEKLENTRRNTSVTSATNPLPYRVPLKPNTHRLGVLIPYRNVSKELSKFVPYMSNWLKSQDVDFEIFVINQTDERRFNRGQLLNVGFLLAEQSCDYIAMHDVDLLPLNANLSYRYPNHVMHIASPTFHPLYKFPKFIGGIVLMKNTDYRQINGLSNKYWGWGREDDDFYMRLSTANIKIERPENYTNITTGREDTLLHMHEPEIRPRDYMKFGKQREIGKKLDNATGLISARHEVVHIGTQFVEGFPYTRIDVNLECDLDLTPWCKMYTECLPSYYRIQPWHKICSPCVRRCWIGFALVGDCNQTHSPTCLKVGRDISVEDAEKWPKGSVTPKT